MSLERLEDFVRQMVHQAPTRLFVQTLLVLDGAEKHSAEAKAVITDKVAAAAGARYAAQSERESYSAEHTSLQCGLQSLTRMHRCRSALSCAGAFS